MTAGNIDGAATSTGEIGMGDNPDHSTRSSIGDFDDPDCPARRALDLVGDKWTPRVVVVLGAGVLRYNALRRALPGISQRMLTRSLRLLEAEQLVTRRVIETNPPSVEYELNPRGRSLVEPILAIARWGTTVLGRDESGRP